MRNDSTPPLAQIRPRDQVHYVSRNRTVLATARDGFLHGDDGQGLFVFQTRLLSLYRYSVLGEELKPVGISNVEEHSQIAYYIFESPDADRGLFQGANGPGGNAATEAIELRLARFVSDGLQEEVEVTNHTMRKTQLVLELEIDADFADPGEISGERKQHGDCGRQWRPDGLESTLAWAYVAAHGYDHQGHQGRAQIRRAVEVRFLHPEPAPSYDEAGKRLSFRIELPPHGSWQCTVLVSADIDGRKLAPDQTNGSFDARTRYEAARDSFLENSAGFDTGSPPLSHVVRQTLEQARRDLFSLRLFDLDRPDGGWVAAAGLPVYIAFFGRDTLTTGWMASLLSDLMMRGALAQLAETQASEADDWRDAQPGRMIHQMETGPLATLMYNPHTRYYGSITGPAFFPVVLSNLWHWSGDLDAVKRYLGTALAGIEWLDREAKDERGFYAYRTRSEQGVKNQGWKDSYDAIVYPDGSQVRDPIALADSQAYVYAAKVRIAEMLWWTDSKDEARRMFDDAMELRDRFHEVYWMEDEGCFGMGLDPKGELIRSVGSESVHAIAAGMALKGHVERAIERMFQPDMFSGWGVRTLSANHPAYNPFSYHRGSVWPAEQAAFSMGLMRYGEYSRLHQLMRAQFEIAALYQYFRLPEVMSGHQRDARHPVPPLYLNADAPQAWSSAGVICMMQAMLGVFPYAPLHSLFVDPHLPEWLPELTVRNLRVGQASADLHFYRKETGKTDYKILDLRGKLRIIHQPSPWSLRADSAERMVDALGSLVK